MTGHRSNLSCQLSLVTCYNNLRRAVQHVGPQMKTRFDLQDLTLRVLIVAAGCLAAVWFALKGQADALPALALGGTLGAFVMAQFSATEE